MGVSVGLVVFALTLLAAGACLFMSACVLSALPVLLVSTMVPVVLGYVSGRAAGAACRALSRTPKSWVSLCLALPGLLLLPLVPLGTTVPRDGFSRAVMAYMVLTDPAGMGTPFGLYGALAAAWLGAWSGHRRPEDRPEH